MPPRDATQPHTTLHSLATHKVMIYLLSCFLSSFFCLVFWVLCLSSSYVSVILFSIFPRSFLYFHFFLFLPHVFLSANYLLRIVSSLCTLVLCYEARTFILYLCNHVPAFPSPFLSPGRRHTRSVVSKWKALLRPAVRMSAYPHKTLRSGWELLQATREPHTAAQHCTAIPAAAPRPQTRLFLHRHD